MASVLSVATLGTSAHAGAGSFSNEGGVRYPCKVDATPAKAVWTIRR